MPSSKKIPDTYVRKNPTVTLEHLQLYFLTYYLMRNVNYLF